MVSPSLPDGWENNKLIVAKNSAARYVSSNGTLHPVINAISARLLIPSSDFKVLTVADDQLKNIPIGSTIGILGAPDSLPEENNLIAGSINSCVSDSNLTRRVPQSIRHSRNRFHRRNRTMDQPVRARKPDRTNLGGRSRQQHYRPRR